MTERRGGRWLPWIVGAVVFIVAGGAVGWAAASVLTPAEDPLQASSFTYVAVAPGEVGSSLNLNTVAAWTPGTVAAVKTWQKALGMPQTGVVEVGDVIFVPQLPTRVALDSDVIARGLMVSGGEQVVRALAR